MGKKNSRKEIKIPKAILMRVFGVISPNSFKKELNAFVRNNIKTYIDEKWGEGDLWDSIAAMKREAEMDQQKRRQATAIIANNCETDQKIKETVIAYVLQRLDEVEEDVKPQCRQLQTFVTLLWKNAFSQRSLKTEIFEDVITAANKWKKEGIKLYTISSLNTSTVKSILCNTKKGDISNLFTEHVSTDGNYKEVCERVGEHASSCFYIVENIAEAPTILTVGAKCAFITRSGKQPSETELADLMVHHRLEPSTRGTPAVVGQSNQWRGGGIISVNYEARSRGVTRTMRGDDAKAVCPELRIFQITEDRGKASLSKYRLASAEVFDVICNFSDLIVVEKASVDEAYLDLTKLVETYTEIPSLESVCDTYLPECRSCNEQLLNTGDCCFKHFYNYVISENETGVPITEESKFIVAAKIVKDIRDAILAKTEFTCSAGISYSKTLAKLGCSVKKPNGQTILPPMAVSTFLSKTPVQKVRNFGGKFGEEVKKKLGIEYIGDINKFTLSELLEKFGKKNATYLTSIAKGFDNEEVVQRLIPKSIGCSKNFPVVQKADLKTKTDVGFWVSRLVEELIERLNRDNSANLRIAKLVTISIRFSNKENVSRSHPLRCYDANLVAEDLMKNVVSKVLSNFSNEEVLKESVILLALSSSKFVDCGLESRNMKLEHFYEKVDKPVNLTEQTKNDSSENTELVGEQESAVKLSNPQKRGFFYKNTLERMLSSNTTGENSKSNVDKQSTLQLPQPQKRFSGEKSTLDLESVAQPLPKPETHLLYKLALEKALSNIPNKNPKTEIVLQLPTPEDGFFYNKLFQLLGHES